MNSPWLTDKGAIKPQLLDEEAEKIAGSLVEESSGQRRGAPKQCGVSSSQLRRVYGEVKGLERQMDASGWERVSPMVKMLRARMAYTVGRSQRDDRNCYVKLQRFIDDSVESIGSEQEFRAFCKQFEAVVGFYYGITKGGLKDRS